MAYVKKGRPSLYTDLRTKDGWWKGVGLPAPNTPAGRKLAQKIERVWETLAEEYREWEVLDAVRAGRLSLGRLYDWWIELDRAGMSPDARVAAIRRRLNDAQLAAIVDPFLVMYRKQVKPEQYKRMERHLGLLTADGLTIEGASTETLTARLYALPVAGNTVRIVHSSWSVFFDHVRRIRSIPDPMRDVARPPATKPPPAFYELDTIEHVVAWQPTLIRRALFAFLYGTGVEISVALTLTRDDVNPAALEVRAPGTKAHSRDRIVRVDDWAWGLFWTEYAAKLAPGAKLFPSIDRHRASKWHRETIGAGQKPCRNQHRMETKVGLQLQRLLKMYAARHAWAARHLRAGVPIEVVQKQLGHASPMETFEVYGRFMPDSSDRAHWATRVAESETKRRAAAAPVTAPVVPPDLPAACPPDVPERETAAD